MKLMICSDLHLGSGHAYLKNTADAQDPAANDEAAFLECISGQIRGQGIQVLLIAGNLTGSAGQDSYVPDMLDRFFRSIPETYIFITPGNSDPYIPGSIYASRSWPGNVKIFTGALKAAELKLPAENGKLHPVRIYGGAYTRHFTPPELISENRLPRLDPGYTNILLTHTPPIGKDGCIAPELLDLSGFDLCACSQEGPLELSPAAPAADTEPTFKDNEACNITVQLVITGSPFKRSIRRRPPCFRIPETLPVIRGKVLSGELLPGKCLLEPAALPATVPSTAQAAAEENRIGAAAPEAAAEEAADTVGKAASGVVSSGRWRTTALCEYFEKTLETARAGTDPEQLKLAEKYAYSALAGCPLIKEGGKNDG